MILTNLHAFVVALMQYKDQKVALGRYNVDQLDFSDDLIVLDELAASETGSGYTYDGDTEQMTYQTAHKGVFTFDFYGDNAYTNAHKFKNLLKSQRSFDLSSLYDFTIYHASQITNLKDVHGVTNYNRYQVEVTAIYYETYTESLLRIDTAQTEFNSSN